MLSKLFFNKGDRQTLKYLYSWKTLNVTDSQPWCQVLTEEEGGEVSFNSFCQQKGPLTPVTVKIKIIYFLESGSVVVHQVRDILGLVSLHQTDLMVPPASINN